MGAFEFECECNNNNSINCGNSNNSCNNHNNSNNSTNLDPRRLREECIIAFKVYDFCRQQDCLTSDILGPARAAEYTVLNGRPIDEGCIIDPPANEGIVKTLFKKQSHINSVPSDFINDFIDIVSFFVK